MTEICHILSYLLEKEERKKTATARICYINGTEETSNKLVTEINRCGYPKFDNCGLFAFFFF